MGGRYSAHGIRFKIYDLRITVYAYPWAMGYHAGPPLTKERDRSIPRTQRRVYEFDTNRSRHMVFQMDQDHSRSG